MLGQHISDPRAAAQVDALAAALAGLTDAGTLLVASTDLSHLDNYADVVRTDRRLVDLVAALDVDGLAEALEEEEVQACGATGLLAVLRACQALGAAGAKVLSYAASGDVTGDKRPGVYTVGYLRRRMLRPCYARRLRQHSLGPCRRRGRLRMPSLTRWARLHLRFPKPSPAGCCSGHLVWVPFRGRRLQAVVLSLTEIAPTFETHEIISLVWAQPLLTSAQLTLAHWISAYYLAPLIEALRLMLPAGLSKRGRTVLVRTAEPAPPTLTPTQVALLARVKESEGTWAEVSEGLRGATQRADLEPLIVKGLISREVSFPTPPPRPKTDRQVRLLADAPTIARVLPTLGRSSKQADVLAWLAGQVASSPEEERTFALDDVCTAACTAGPVEASGPARLDRGHAPCPGENLPRYACSCVGDCARCPGRALAAAEAPGVLEVLQRHDGPAWIGWVYAETGAHCRRCASGSSRVDHNCGGDGLGDPLAGQEFTLDRPLADRPEQVCGPADQASSAGSRGQRSTRRTRADSLRTRCQPYSSSSA
jgi:hypothetical protein